MADKEQAQPTPIDPENPPAAIEQDADKTVRELRDVSVEEIPEEQLPEIAADIKTGESSEVREARRAVEDALNKPIEGIEDVVNELDREDQAHVAEGALPHAASNTTVLLGRVIPLPLYTVVFIILAAITAVEVVLAELPHGFLTAPLLLVLSGAKAVLVVLFYMHLRDDSRMFAVALALPLFIAIVASLFLLSVPVTGY